ncbi:MAG: DHHW family protein [Clostridia bacterium]|nr:DHHW family protein [Clostridia bacterium]
MTKLQKAINLIFVLVVCSVLLIGAGRTVFKPKDVNEYENRYSNKLGKLNTESYLNSAFQDSVEDALADQIPFAEKIKEFYNNSISGTINYMLENVFGFKLTVSEEEIPEIIIEPEDPWKWLMETPDTEFLPSYVKLSNGMKVRNGHILYGINELEWSIDNINHRIENINQIMENHPDIEYYAYYVEKETDIEFETGRKMGISDYVMEHINIPSERKGIFKVKNFFEFDRFFYKVDHHWNHLGSYRGYREICQLFGFEPIEPLWTSQIGMVSGSKATGPDASAFTEKFFAFKFNFPHYEVWLNGGKAGDYGYLESIFAKNDEAQRSKRITYGSVYGQDNGETIIKNPSSDGGNILVLGDSFDNPLLKLLANHFTTLYSVDNRNYESLVGKTFNLEEYLKDKEIDKVLFVGNSDFFRLGAFNIK